MKDSPTLIVLAAGMGTRYGGLKQIAPVDAAGNAILDYSVFDAARAGFGKVVFVIRRDIEQALKERIGSKFQSHIDVAYAFQQLEALPAGFTVPAGRTKPWGTLQATLVGAEQVDGTFAVINADDFYGAESYRVLAQHLLRDTPQGAMVGFRLRNTLSDFGAVSRGVCKVGKDDLLVGVKESKKIERKGTGAANVEEDGSLTELSGDELVSMNMWGFTIAVIPQLQAAFQTFLQQHGSELTAESYLPQAMNTLVFAGSYQVKVLHTSDAWCGMTYPEDHDFVVAHIASLTHAGNYPETLWP
ncbi:MAG: sugar phosphate nucleotidyltransferase [Janthinobacterium lividum]